MPQIISDKFSNNSKKMCTGATNTEISLNGTVKTHLDCLVSVSTSVSMNIASHPLLFFVLEISFDLFVIDKFVIRR